MDQEIRFCTRPDGVQIAYALVGGGPPLLCIYPWGNIEVEWEILGGHRAFMEGFAAHHTIVRFDRYGTGLSDRNREDFSLDADVLDIQAVVDHLRLEGLAIFGIGSGAAVAVAYAASHPDRVTELVLARAYARGESIAPPAVRDVLLETIEVHWGLGSRTLAALIAPEDDADFVSALARFTRESVAPRTAVQMLRASYEHDLSDAARRVRARTVIIQGKRDPFVPFAAGRELAALIPEARFVALERSAAMDKEFSRHVAEFLGDPAPGRSAAAPVTVIVTDRESSTAITQRVGDEPAHELQRVHDRVVRQALQTHDGAEVKHLGDGLMAKFASPSAAIACAIDIQRALAAREDVRVRIGLAAGEVVADADDIFGSTVQLASRVCARARPGQILVPEAVRQLAGGKGFTFGESRSVTLKGFPERVRIYEVDWSETQ